MQKLAFFRDIIRFNEILTKIDISGIQSRKNIIIQEYNPEILKNR